jgi:hypothetical protein
MSLRLRFHNLILFESLSMLSIYKRIRDKRVSSMGCRNNAENKALVGVTTLTDILEGDSVTPSTPGLANDGKLSSARSDDLSVFITLNIPWQFTSVTRLLSPVNARVSSSTASLYRIGRDNIETLRERVSDESLLTVLYRRENLSGRGLFNPFGRVLIDSLLNEVSESFWALRMGTPAGLGGRRHSAVQNTKVCLYKVGGGEVSRRQQQDYESGKYESISICVMGYFDLCGGA